jgi:hypothetical protein
MALPTQNDSASSTANGWALEDIISGLQQLHLTYEEAVTATQSPPLEQTAGTTNTTCRCSYLRAPTAY